jgi:hypothetical protein
MCVLEIQTTGKIAAGKNQSLVENFVLEKLWLLFTLVEEEIQNALSSADISCLTSL